VSAEDQARIWQFRESSLGLSMAMKGDAKALSFVEDTAVSPEKLRDYIERFLKIVHGHGTTAGVYAHASVGCLHVRPVVNMKTETGCGASRRSPPTSPN
jgi:FAD/FMN-containing dehydrogenase